jgi:hypothetical protein
VFSATLGPHWSAYNAQRENARDKTIVFRGCLGCLTDDCDKWDEECQPWTPCIIGRRLSVRVNANA